MYYKKKKNSGYHSVLNTFENLFHLINNYVCRMCIKISISYFDTPNCFLSYFIFIKQLSLLNFNDFCKLNKDNLYLIAFNACLIDI